jgi:hypothetical protein
MKYLGFLSPIIILIISCEAASVGQSDSRQAVAPESKSTTRAAPTKGCTFSILGVWKSDATSETNPIYYSFSSTGWVTVLRHTAGALPEDFEMVTQAQYRLDKDGAPTRLEFTTTGKNDSFASGTSSLEIIQYSDDSFTVADLKTGYRTRWDRVEARRYFLTLAGRRGVANVPGPVLAIWTTLDGRKIDIEALGVHLRNDEAGTTLAVFESPPVEAYSEFSVDTTSEQTVRDGDGDVRGKDSMREEQRTIFRVELTESEFERSHKVYETWQKYVKAKALPNANPYANVHEFLTRIIESLNQCSEKLKEDKSAGLKPEVSVVEAAQRPLEYIRQMRKMNDELHVHDAMFPWMWRPSIELSQ